MVDAEYETTFPANKDGVAAALDLLMKTAADALPSRPAAHPRMRTSG